MTGTGVRRLLGVCALGCAVLLAPTPLMTHASDEEADAAILARHGFMSIIALETGPLFAMAKGDVPYDAEAAAARAAHLDALARYDFGRLFAEGTSEADRPGETRALAAIWDDGEGFDRAWADMQAATAVLAAEAGKGREALVAAATALGRTCGGCHRTFRARDR